MRPSPLIPHPRSVELLESLGNCPRDVAVEADVFRFTHLTFANQRDALTGEGSRKVGGRWNPKGSCPTLYFSLTPETALAEAVGRHRDQDFPDAMATPLVLLSCNVNVQPVLDLTSEHVLSVLSLTPDDLRATWWAEQHEGKQALTQAIGRLAKHLAFQGILAPSARVAGLNLMLFRERVSDRELTIVNPDAFPLARRRLRR